MQSFVERIERYPERRKDGNWIKNILFNFSIPVIRDEEELARIDGISMETGIQNGVDIPLEKLPTHEMVVLLSQQKPDDHIEIEIDLDEIDATSAEMKASYDEIRDWVQEKYGFHVTNLNIAQVKQKHGIIERENYNKPKSPGAKGPVDLCPARTGVATETSKQPGTSDMRIKAIEQAMRHFQMI